ncbi:hypothetical protein JR316_0003140 [Psilocybe cubensis]|uniref:Mid2 domain-containing protein n=2 Tax=Psilocybe cubensis TaxID=181762 RepID=A0A8H7Y1V0_PSICU|nr:hypothetical protein JR316_0003140 [Psilocybe cubensis]KAH9483670.1 hypothetical protein JR316_0003140 [Psilocybe cubensis]
MAPLQLTLKLVLFLLISCSVLVGASHNVTVDDDDTSQIIYDPPDSWRETPFDPLNAGGRHRVTSDPDATATFTFTGTAIYFYAPLWPFEVTTAVSLDGNPPVTINLMDPATISPEEDAPETVQSQVVWSVDGLDNVEHTLVVSVALGDDHAVVDTLVYTVLDDDDPTPTTTTDDSSASSTALTSLSSSSTSSSSFSLLPPPTPSTSPVLSDASSATAHKGLSIALGIVCTVFALLVFYGIYWYWRRRQRIRREREEEEEYARNHPSSSEPEVPSVGYEYRRQPTAWQRNSRGRLVAASTGITTTDSPFDSELSGTGSVRGASTRAGRRPRPPAPRRHGPSPLSISSSASESSSSVTGSSSGKKNPLTTIPEMRMREDVDIDASPSVVKSQKALDARNSREGLATDIGSTQWTTFDDQSS